MTLPPPTACERAFALPEILERIFDILLFDDDVDDWANYTKCFQGEELVDFLKDSNVWSTVMDYNEDQLKTLAICARVCRAWFREAIPILWVHRTEWLALDRHSDTLEGIFDDIEPHRRQLYANHIVRGGLNFDCKYNHQKEDTGILASLSFPRLLGVRITIRDGRLPAFDAPNLAWLELDPHYEPPVYGPEIWGADPDVWDPLFEAISKRFPALRLVNFQDQLFMYSDSLPLLRAKRPDIEIEGEGHIAEVERST